MISGGKAYIYIDGKRIEVDATSVEISYEYENAYPQVELQGYVRVMDKEGTEMARCEEYATARDDGPGCYGSNLAKRVQDLDLSEDERLLLKYRVVEEDGTLTQAGKDVLLQLLFSEYFDEVLDKLKALEEAEKN